jgi:hypothetical protein
MTVTGTVIPHTPNRPPPHAHSCIAPTPLPPTPNVPFPSPPKKPRSFDGHISAELYYACDLCQAAMGKKGPRQKAKAPPRTKFSRAWRPPIFRTVRRAQRDPTKMILQAAYYDGPDYAHPRRGRFPYLFDVHDDATLLVSKLRHHDPHEEVCRLSQ